MTDHNRGAYTPQSDAPLAFDARRVGGAGRRPLPITLLVSLAILAVLVIGALVLYKNGPRSADQPPAPVGEPVGEVRGAAEGQPAEPPGLQVYEAGQPAGGAAPVFTPPPEQPVRPAPVESAPLPPPPVATNSMAALPPAPVVSPSAPAVPAPAAKAQPAPKTPAPAPKAAAAPANVPAPTSAAKVQIGAFSSTTLADAGWNKVARLMPGEMVGKTKVIETVERDGQTLYRALVGGFASRAEADRLCGALRAAGEACAVRN